MTNTLKTGLGFAFVIAAGCSSAPDRQLPSASFTPHLDSTPAPIACGDDVALYGDTTPDLRYLYTYDTAGLISHMDGAYAAGGSDESIDYAWSGDNMTQMVDTNGWGGANSTIDASYDAASNLLDYVWDYTQGSYHDHWDYAFSTYAATYEPGREVITEQGQMPFGYTLAYDAAGRLTTATPDDGSAPTTWSYDDDGLTITVDTGDGAFTGTYVYDDQYRELNEDWGGSDPSAVESTDVFAWNGDQLSSATYSSGTTDQPDDLELVETDTLRYDCPTARTSSGRTMHLRRPQVRAAR